MMRGDLQALIDYTGLSLREAADLIGISHEALSRKLAGKERYVVRQGEIDALASLAALQDRAVEMTIRRIDQLVRDYSHPSRTGEVRVTLISYRSTTDMPRGEEWPTASSQRMVIARVKAQAGLHVDLITFDPADYGAWRSKTGRTDDRTARQEWASERADQGQRLALKMDVDAVGWALWRTSGMLPPRYVDSGDDNLSE